MSRRNELFGQLAALRARHDLPLDGALNLPMRQQALAQALAGGYHRLDAVEQAIFARLSVCAGGCRLAAAEAIIADDPAAQAGIAIIVPSAALLKGMQSLVAKNMLRRELAPDGAPRFRMLEPVRVFALECLAQRGESALIHRRHAMYMADMITQLQTSGQAEGMSRLLDQELNNLRTALRWAIRHDIAEPALRIVAAFFFWENHPSEGRHWLREVLALPSAAHNAEPYQAAWYSEGTLARQQGDVAAARSAFATYIASAAGRSAGDDRFARWSLAWCDLAEDEAARALVTFRELFDAFAAARSVADDPNSTWLSLSHGWLAFGIAAAALQLGDLDSAQRSAQAAAEHFAYAGAQAARLYAHAKLGYIAAERNQIETAQHYLVDGLGQADAIGSLRGRILCISGLALTAWRADEPVRAAHLLGVAEACKGQLGLVMDPDIERVDLRTSAALQAALGESAYSAAFLAGYALDVPLQPEHDWITLHTWA